MHLVTKSSDNPVKDPLRIFTKAQLETLNDYNLRLLKKEFFIPFKFGGKSSIILNNHEVDEATLTTIFNVLEGNLDEYLVGFNNIPLSNFLENGELDFLFDDKQFNEITNLISQNPKVEFRVADKLVEIIAKLCKNPTSKSLKTLHIISVFINDFDPKNQEHAYKFAQEDIDQYLSKLWNEFKSPFKNSSDTKYKEEIGLIVNPLRSKMLSILPSSFDIFDYKYSKWCEEVIIEQSVRRQSDFNKYSKRELKVFIDAAKIAIKNSESEQLNYYLKSAKIALMGGGKQKKGLSCIGTIVGVFLLIRIVVGIGKCSQPERNKSIFNQQDILTEQQREQLNRSAQEYYRKKQEEGSKNTENPSKDNSQSSDEIEKDSETIKNSDKKGSEETSRFNVDKSRLKSKEVRKPSIYRNFSNKELNKKFSGEEIEKLDLQKTKSSYKVDTIRLEFKTEVLPFTDDNLGGLLPPEVEKGGKNKTTAAYITFINPALNIKTTHLVDIFYNLDDQPPSTSYIRKTNKSNSKLSLRAKRIPFSDYNLKGQLILKDLNKGKTKEKIDFTIKYDSALKKYSITYGKRKLTLSQNAIKNPSTIPFNNAIGKKFATIISNLGLLHNTYLKEKNYYAIREIIEYKIASNSQLSDNSISFQKGNGNARFKFASAADNFAYCELNTDNTSYKYIFDHKSGIVEGMTRVTTSSDKTEVEQVLIFRK